jgi:HAMP domain-containing protein
VTLSRLWGARYGPPRLGTKITLSVSFILVMLLLGSASVFVYYEYAFFRQNVRGKAERTLFILEAVLTQAMLHQGEAVDDNPVIDTLNGTFDQLSETSKSMTLWLVMGPKVLAYQEQRGAREREPPRDEVDREAIATATPVARMVGDNMFRLSRPVILGQGVATDPQCFKCHGVDMGIEEGEIIGAFSVALSVADDYQWFTTTMRGVFLISILASLVIAAVSAVLLKRLASDPISSITGVMGRLAGGDLEVDIPGRGRRDEIGDMGGAPARDRAWAGLSPHHHGRAGLGAGPRAGAAAGHHQRLLRWRPGPTALGQLDVPGVHGGAGEDLGDDPAGDRDHSPHQRARPRRRAPTAADRRQRHRPLGGAAHRGRRP